jgi:hypothetical protein
LTQVDFARLADACVSLCRLRYPVFHKIQGVGGRRSEVGARDR